MPHDDVTIEVKTWLSAAGLAVKASYRVDEVARLLSIGERTVYTWIQAGRLASLDTTPPTTGAPVHRTPTRIPLTTLIRLHDGQ